uniref:methionine--tRNA ligase n=1 Tax=Strombidium inclinatum TaxID=197538 RepID=A0A7S3N2G1_9SPIT|mmetsp:Transcript_42355/g.64995  ORF Transcript_42355/g.64995 Transcript_42355/m.64995 type:complete len:431 (+) Transcript_42355:1131-2423(+)
MCHFYDARGDQCDGCGKLINAIELIKPKCSLCKATPEPRESKHIFIDLGKIQPKCQEFVEKQSVEGKWSYNATFFTNNLLKEGLHGRCITRDLKWGTPIPLEEYNNKVFYVWFDAPIGYISITANYLGAETEDYRKWWQNKENVELFQFMGKDNTTFHTLIFPSSLIGSGQPWTMLKTISTTEFLNYEIDEETGKPKKFSKSRGVGIFGDDAQNTGIPPEVWRYYLLSNRPEQQDTVFLWKDFIAKNNSELLKNLGNFSNRCLKFLAATFDGVVPVYEGERHPDDTKFLSTIFAQFEEYLDLLEKIKIKDGLRVAMNVSSLCNTYWQDSQLWTIAKSDKKRAHQVMNTAIQVTQVLAAMMEPYMPSFSAKIYHQLALKRTETHDVLFEFLTGHPERMESLIPGGHKIGEPQPIFREISEEEMESLKKRYG